MWSTQQLGLAKAHRYFGDPSSRWQARSPVLGPGRGRNLTPVGSSQIIPWPRGCCCGWPLDRLWRMPRLVGQPGRPTVLRSDEAPERSRRHEGVLLCRFFPADSRSSRAPALVHDHVVVFVWCTHHAGGPCNRGYRSEFGRMAAGDLLRVAVPARLQRLPIWLRMCTSNGTRSAPFQSLLECGSLRTHGGHFPSYFREDLEWANVLVRAFREIG